MRSKQPKCRSDQPELSEDGIKTPKIRPWNIPEFDRN
jgi:hypothetical protein